MEKQKAQATSVQAQFKTGHYHKFIILGSVTKYLIFFIEKK